MNVKSRAAVAARVTRVSRGAVLAAASAVCYGSLAVLAKLAFLEGWNVPSLLAARFLLAGLVVLPFALRAEGSWRGFGWGLLVGGLGYAGTTALYFPSLKFLPAAVASFLLYLAPPIVAALGVAFFRERLDRRAAIALALGMVGLAVLSVDGFRGDLAPVGIALAAGSAVLYALTVLGSRHLLGGLPWPRATLAVCAGAFLSYLAFAAATGQLEVPASPRGLAYAVGIGTLATGVALSLFMAALPLIGASRTALVSTLEPVSTLVLGLAALGEVPTWTGLLGGALILGAAALVATSTSEPEAEARAGRPR
ncbi:MAG TPA: EamA family transporter [Candidatus Thermoplasmatota archaeon]|nr:EamA family transporter [Candidatus Thermoplasmatota archaeon]